MRLFVANLHKKITENRLRSLLAQYGQVGMDVEMWTGVEFGKLRGFGLIELEDRFDGKRAIIQLNGICWRGTRIRVSEAHAPKHRR
jgi:RNA recognition motif-containing protein